MNFFQTLGISLSLGLCIVGCQTATLSPREAFLAVTKTQRKDYLQLYEVSVEVLRDREGEVFRATKIGTRGARDAMRQCTNSCPVLQQTLDSIEHFAGIIRSNRLQMIGRLEMEYDPKVDTALYYHLQTEGREELGWAVMHGRKLKSKIVLFDDDTQSELDMPTSSTREDEIRKGSVPSIDTKADGL